MREIVTALADHAKTMPEALAVVDVSVAGSVNGLGGSVNGLGRLSFKELAGRVAYLAKSLQKSPETIAIFAPNCALWVIADLALAVAGKTMVPLPTFFSPEQLSHILQDSKVDLILTVASLEDQAKALGRPCRVLSETDDTRLPLPDDLSAADKSGRIIYTSGTTGTPKGVRIGSRQISASAQGLVAASGATKEDRYLSVLPFSLLLEQIAAICVPLIAGAPLYIEANAAAAATQGDIKPLVQAYQTHQPTASVLVPSLLSAWVQGLLAMRLEAPESLRFVAVGGAPVSPALADTAWALGIPVHEGYGLSECCSVVSVNRPGARKPGTVGLPLDGTHISIVDGEIVIKGPTVMDGYLGRENLDGQVWHTGDLGEITEHGEVRIFGRKDKLIVTQNGRNINPEWIETLAQDAPGVVMAKLTLTPEQDLVLNVTHVPGIEIEDLPNTVRAALSGAPDYAQPTQITLTNMTSLRTAP